MNSNQKYILGPCCLKWMASHLHTMPHMPLDVIFCHDSLVLQLLIGQSRKTIWGSTSYLWGLGLITPSSNTPLCKICDKPPIKSCSLLLLPTSDMINYSVTPRLKSRSVVSNFLQTHSGFSGSTNQRAAILRRRTNQEPTFSLTPSRCNKANGDKQSLVLVPPGNCCNCEQCWSLPLSSSSPSSSSSTGWSPRILTGELKHWTRCRSQIRSIWFKFT